MVSSVTHLTKENKHSYDANKKEKKKQQTKTQTGIFVKHWKLFTVDPL